VNRPAQPVWYSLVAILVSVLVTVAAAVVYTNSTARESERKWCDVVTTMDDAYQVAPPTTEIGRKLARDIHRLRERFDCP
jgi:hypothetical protein